MSIKKCEREQQRYIDARRRDSDADDEDEDMEPVYEPTNQDLPLERIPEESGDAGD